MAIKLTKINLCSTALPSTLHAHTHTHTIAHISVNLIQVNCFSAPTTHRQWRAFVALVLLHPEQTSEYRAKLVFFWCKFSMTAKVTTARLYLCVAFSGGMVRFFIFPLPASAILVTCQTPKWEERRRRGSVTGNPVKCYKGRSKAHCISWVLSVTIFMTHFQQVEESELQFDFWLRQYFQLGRVSSASVIHNSL